MEARIRRKRDLVNIEDKFSFCSNSHVPRNIKESLRKVNGTVMLMHLSDRPQDDSSSSSNEINNETKWNIKRIEKKNSSNHFGIIMKRPIYFFRDYTFTSATGGRETERGQQQIRKRKTSRKKCSKESRNVLESKKKTIYSLGKAHQYIASHRIHSTRCTKRSFTTFFTFLECERVAGRKLEAHISTKRERSEKWLGRRRRRITHTGCKSADVM